MNQNQIRFLRIGIAVAAAVLLFCGIYRGEPATIFRAAVNICFECIGLG